MMEDLLVRNIKQYLMIAFVRSNKFYFINKETRVELKARHRLFASIDLEIRKLAYKYLGDNISFTPTAGLSVTPSGKELRIHGTWSLSAVAHFADSVKRYGTVAPKGNDLIVRVN